jgi:hypothetical protein
MWDETHHCGLTAFGPLTVTAMLARYSLKKRSPLGCSPSTSRQWNPWRERWGMSGDRRDPEKDGWRIGVMNMEVLNSPGTGRVWYFSA